MTGKHRITVDGIYNDHCNTCGQRIDWHEFYSRRGMVHFVRHDPRDDEPGRRYLIDPEYARLPLSLR